MAKVLKFLLRFRSRRFVLVALAGAVSGAASAALIAIITRSLSHGAGSIRTSLLFVALVLCVLGTSYVSRLLSLRLTQQTSHDLRLRLCREIVATPLRSCEEIGRDKLLATIVEDVNSINNALMALPGAFINLALLAGCLVYLGWLSMPVLSSLLVFLAFAIISVLIPERRAKELFRLARADWNQMVALFRDMTEGEKELRMHKPRREAFLSQHLSAAASTLRDRRIQSGDLQSRIASWFQVLYFVYVGLLLFAFPGIEKADLVGYTLALLFIRAPLSSLVGLVSTLNQAGVALENVQQMGLRLAEATPLEPAQLLPPSPCRTLRLEGVWHTYYRDTEERSFALGPVSLELRAGEVTLITGGNGSGKTTLVKLCMGLYTPEEGRILLDGREIGEEEREWYRQHFSVVFSDFYLFEKLLGLGSADLDATADVYLARLQLSHKVSVQGGVLSTRSLSQGQRKRLALLTAYLEDRPIYVFDEWAADQDPEFKKVFYDELLPELKRKGKMVIVITHDDFYFGIADHLVRLDSGQVVLEHRAVDSILSSADETQPGSLETGATASSSSWNGQLELS